MDLQKQVYPIFLEGGNAMLLTVSRQIEVKNWAIESNNKNHSSWEYKEI